MRLTKKFTLVENGYYYYSTQDNEYTSPLVDKLGQLEDIEEKLGIDLITLFKALKDGIYISKNDKRFIPVVLIHKNMILELEIGYKDYVSVKDYGKTWALTKEELL